MKVLSGCVPCPQSAPRSPDSLSTGLKNTGGIDGQGVSCPTLEPLRVAWVQGKQWGPSLHIKPTFVIRI